MKCYYKITQDSFWPWKYKLSCAIITPRRYDLIYQGTLKNCQQVLNEIEDGKRDKDGMLIVASAEIEFKD